ncbi:tetratricopeptide repeat protein [Saccharopolyspora sp. HNM0983]|uniref:Tetratricopeptide repeat protein n=1 Tax=Saccharopolyspora montiporae TaxID=2781240 RepID=A0A929BAZ7_9PSEU|nr:tetratricopeptide repeat protein [Saccharopolyspora sp. HNM0983]MBE9375511.1 tetratricopeptide repeat protein [Saccharopolyspora sp. HNM0983]
MGQWEQRIDRARDLHGDGEHAAAEAELRAVLEGADAAGSAHAARLLGALRDEQGDPDGALELHQRCLESGVAEHAQHAALALGPLLFDRDDLENAQVVLRHASRGPDPAAAAKAQALLAQVLHVRGDTRGARQARELAAASGEPAAVGVVSGLQLPEPDPAEDVAPGIYARARRLLDGDERSRAEPLLGELLDGGDAEYASLAAAELAALHPADLGALRPLAERIIGHRHPEHLAHGQVLLASALADAGEHAAAERELRRAAQDPRPDVRLDALHRMAGQQRRLGNTAEAQRTLERVAATRHPLFAARALESLADLHRQTGDPHAAAAALRDLVRSTSGTESDAAAYRLGSLLFELGDSAGAVEAFQHASEARDAALAHQAAVALDTVQDPAGGPGAEPVEAASPPPAPETPAHREVPAVDDSDPVEETGDPDDDPDARPAPDGDAAAEPGPEAPRAHWAALAEQEDEPGAAALVLAVLDALTGDEAAARAELAHIRDTALDPAAQQAALRLALLDEPDARLRMLLPEEAGGTPADEHEDELSLLLRAERDGADEPPRELADGEHPLVRARAALLLAPGLAHQDAVELLHRAVRTGPPELLPWLHAHLGEALRGTGDAAGAVEQLRAAHASGLPAVQEAVFDRLATLHRDRDERADLLELYRSTAESQHPQLASWSAHLLAELLAESGALDEALDRFDRLRERGGDLGGVAAFAAHALREEPAEEAFDALRGGPQHRTASRLCLALAHGFEHHRRIEQAGDVLRLVIESGHPSTTQHGWLLLGVLHRDSGDHAGAAAAWERAAEGADPEEAAVARCSLAEVLADDGEPERAEALLAEVAEGRSDNAGGAAHRLGALLEQRGDVSAAVAAFERAEAVGSPAEAAYAAGNIGILLGGSGRIAEARAAFERAMASEVPSARAHAAQDLGDLLAGSGDEAGAREAYRRALDCGDPEVTASASERLAPADPQQRAERLLADGDSAGARALLAEHWESDLVAQFWCAVRTDPACASGLLRGADPADQHRCAEIAAELSAEATGGARTALLRVVAEAGPARSAAQARIDLAEQAVRDGQHAIALVWLRQAMSTAAGETADRAAVRLGALLLRFGDADGADAVCRRVPDGRLAETAVLRGSLHALRGAPDAADEAWAAAETAAGSAEEFGTLVRCQLLMLGETGPAARPLLHRAADSRDPETAAQGMLVLGRCASAQRDPRAAADWFARADRLDVVGTSAAAGLELGHALVELDDPAGARAQYERLGDDPDVGVRAQLGLGGLRRAADDPAGAVTAFVRACDSRDRELAELALERIREVLQEQRRGAGVAADVLHVLREVPADHGSREQLLALACGEPEPVVEPAR